MSRKKLSIIVPCYNESGNITLIIQRFLSVVDADTEVVLVNNGSIDNSAEILQSELAKLDNHPFKVVNIAVNKGYGYGILSGLEAASGSVLAWTHADMQTDPKDVVDAFNLYTSLNEPMAVVKGKRLNRPILDTFLTYGMGLLSSACLKVTLYDVNAQPKVFSQEFYKKFISNQAPYDFSLDLYLVYCAQKHSALYEIPVTFGARLHGESKGGGGSLKNRWKLIKRTVSYIFALRKKVIYPH